MNVKNDNLKKRQMKNAKLKKASHRSNTTATPTILRVKWIVM